VRILLNQQDTIPTDINGLEYEFIKGAFFAFWWGRGIVVAFGGTGV
jgi:hypothetical protein